MTATPNILIAVLAHNEEALISDCLHSLPLGAAGVAVHVIVNGSTDATAARARKVAGVTVHEYEAGGKARSWNRFLFDDCDSFANFYVFVDGDTVAAPGAITALVDVLERCRDVNAAGAVPLNGRNAAANQMTAVRDRGLFGALYAVRGTFLDRMKRSGIRLPDDLIGDDGLIGALVKADLGPESGWIIDRVATTPTAQFVMSAPFRSTNPASWRMQYRRMTNYSERHFQNRIISAIMRDAGPQGLPRMMIDVYAVWLPTFRPRRSLRWWWFDRRALKLMSAAAVPGRGHREPDRAR
jgi:cellulose synthase/poly-beta-1,6-N-acetylglucosamine synthase-like glycosyltransferase